MRFTFSAAFGLVVFCGCATNHPVHTNSGVERVGTGTVSWDSLDGDVWLVIWYDQGSENTDQNSYFIEEKWDATKGRVELHRRQSTLDGRKFEVRATIAKYSRTGEVEINGEQFQISNGNIFLTSTRGLKPGTVQVKSDLAGFQPTRANLGQFAEGNAVIKAFVGSLKAEKK